MLNSKEDKSSFFSDSSDSQQFTESGKFSESEKKIQNHKVFELFFAKNTFYDKYNQIIKLSFLFGSGVRNL